MIRFSDENVTLHHGDSIEVLAELPEASVDAVVTDPPYELGFMGKAWDASGIAYSVDLWREVLRVVKPGGHLLAFGGTRTWHRMVVAIEDAGFEIRDELAWLYGQGFPKSMNIACKCTVQPVPYDHGESAAERDLRPLRDADVPAPFDAGDERREVLFEGVPQSGASAPGWAELPPAEGRSGEPRLEGRGDLLAEGGQLPGDQVRAGAGVGAADGPEGRLHHGTSPVDGGAGGPSVDSDRGGAPRGSRPAEQRSGEPGAVADQPTAQAGGVWPTCGRCGQPLAGLGTALKPAHEPICLARKPLVGTVAANVLEHGTGALNIDGCRIGTEGGTKAGERQRKPDGRLTRWDEGSTGARNTIEVLDAGRWPANVVLDEEAAALLDQQSGQAGGGFGVRGRGGEVYGGGDGYTANLETGQTVGYGDSGGASRFFYVAKAAKHERPRVDGKAHATVKPVELMRWLVRLVTPPGGLVLDPFAGSGTTAEACIVEGIRCVLIEKDADHLPLIEARLSKPIAPTLFGGAS